MPGAGPRHAPVVAGASRPADRDPCHYWTFAEQGAGDPAGFVHACARLAPKVNAMLLRPGEGYTLERSSRKQ